MRRPSRAVNLLALLSVLIPGSAVAAAPQEEPPAAVDPSELPEPGLEGLEPAVAEQLAEMRAFVVRQITETEAAPSELAEAIGELGRLYLAYELDEPAEQCLALADRLAPRDFRWTYHLGYLTQGLGRLEEAAVYYERALAIAPTVGPAKIRLAQVYADLGHPARAEWVLRDALAADPTSAATQATLGELLVAEKRYREAAELLRSALELEPGADRLYYPLALALRGLGNEDEARAMIARRGTVGLRPADPLIDGLAELAIGARVQLLRGRSAFRAGRFEEAAREFAGAIESQPDNVAAYINMGSALFRLGDADGAIANYRKAIELAPGNATALYNLGALLKQRGELTAAVESLRNAALYAPEDGGVRFELADALRLAGRGADALLHYRKAAELEPPGEMARFREAQILTDEGLWGEARRRLEEGLALAPRSSLLALSLGRLLASAPDADVRDGKRAVEVLENAPIRRSLRAFETLAMAYAEAGQCDKAVELQGQALEAALDQDREELATGLRATLALYEQGPPCRYPLTAGAAISSDG